MPEPSFWDWYWIKVGLQPYQTEFLLQLRSDLIHISVWYDCQPTMIQYKSQHQCYRMPLRIVRKTNFLITRIFFFRNKTSQHTVNQQYTQPLPILAYLQATFSLVNSMRFSEGCLSRKFIISACSSLAWQGWNTKYSRYRLFKWKLRKIPDRLAVRNFCLTFAPCIPMHILIFARKKQKMTMLTQERYINPYTDFGFKKLFGNEMK